MSHRPNLRVVAASPDAAPPTAGVDRTLVVRGLRLHTQHRPGTALPPLLLLHGIGSSLDSWGPLLAALPDREIIMVDAPGTGRSSLPWRPIGIRAIGEHIADAVRELGVAQPIDVLGYSLGGLVAQELAYREPTLVRRLVLVSTIVGLFGPPPSLKVHRALMSTRRYGDPAAAERDIPVLAGGRTARDPAVLAAILADRASHKPSPLGYRYQQWAALGFNSWRWLPELRSPTLVLHGEEDPVVHVLHARVLARRIPDAELVIVPRAGHMLLFDESKKTAAVLERFLAPRLSVS